MFTHIQIRLPDEISGVQTKYTFKYGMPDVISGKQLFIYISRPRRSNYYYSDYFVSALRLKQIFILKATYALLVNPNFYIDSLAVFKCTHASRNYW